MNLVYRKIILYLVYFNKTIGLKPTTAKMVRYYGVWQVGLDWK